MSDEKKTKKVFSQWLEKLQQESWQLELLISGFSLFGIWESREGVNMFKEYLDVHDPFKSEAIVALDMMGILFQSIWAIFFINLLIHVILRGLWIGAIGLRYVSDEIDYESFNYSNYFREYLENQVGSFDKYIERLEKICSVIFAYTFLLFFIFFSFIIYIIEVIFLIRLLDFLLIENGHHAIAIFIIMIFIFGGLIVFLDFITQGSLKKIRHHRISKGYGYLYRFYSFITLSFIYRPLLYNFIDYKYTSRLFWFSIPYILVIILIAPGFFLVANPYFPSLNNMQDEYVDIRANTFIWNYYDNLRNENRAITRKSSRRDKIRYLSLGTNELSGPYGKIFLAQRASDEALLKHKLKITPFRRSGLRHKLFFSEIEEDSLLLDASQQRKNALLQIIREKRDAKKKDTPSSEETETNAVDDFKKGFEMGVYGQEKNTKEKSIWDLKKDSVRNYWDAYIDRLEKDKLEKIKNGFLNLNQVYIDSVHMNSMMKCEYYIHPNLGEKGLLCYFPTDTLQPGHHYLNLERAIYNPRLGDSMEIKTIQLPFFFLER